MHKSPETGKALVQGVQGSLRDSRPEVRGGELTTEVKSPRDIRPWEGVCILF